MREWNAPDFHAGLIARRRAQRIEPVGGRIDRSNEPVRPREGAQVFCPFLILTLYGSIYIIFATGGVMHRLWMIALLAWQLLPLPAWAGEVDVFEDEHWLVFGGSDDTSGQIAICTAASKTKSTSGTMLLLNVDPHFKLTLALSNRTWQFKDQTSLALQLAIDGGQALKVAAHSYNDRSI